MLTNRILLLSAPLLASVAFVIGVREPNPQPQPVPWQLKSIGALGGEGSSVRFGPIAGLSVDLSGNVIVSQPDSGKLLVVGSAGHLVARLGSSGPGSGPFSSIQEFGRIGDSLFVIEGIGDSRRVHRYDVRFNLLDTVPLRTAALNAAEGRGIPLALLRNGWILARGTAPSSSGEFSYYVTDVKGDVRRRITGAPQSRTQLAIPDPGVILSLPEMILYEDQPLIRVSPDASRLIVVDRAAATDSRTASYSVTVVRPDGTILWSRSYDYTPVPLSGVTAEQAISRASQRLASEFGGVAAADRAIRAALGKLPKYDTPISHFVAGNDGTIWLAESSNGPNTRWVVLDPLGTHIGTLVVPSSFFIAAAQRSRVWSVTSQNGAWFVERYAVEPAR